jgi:hypothetical protein
MRRLSPKSERRQRKDRKLLRLRGLIRDPRATTEASTSQSDCEGKGDRQLTVTRKTVTDDSSQSPIIDKF